jgi:hypothetical protein
VQAEPNGTLLISKMGIYQTQRKDVITVKQKIACVLDMFRLDFSSHGFLNNRQNNYLL